MYTREKNWLSRLD
nr:unnamed protein product [Callosobruchus chinensis]